MITFEMEDLIGVLQGLTPYLIAMGVAIIAAIAVIIAVKKLPKPKKHMIRWEAVIAMLLVIVLCANLICFGPMAALLSLVAGGGEQRTTLTDDLTKEAEAAALRIAEEGFVLLDNDGILPMKDTKKLNLFGWASTNPVYGGAGSGGINDLYPMVSLIGGLEQSGFEINKELVDFYTAFAPNRAAVSITAQNWNLPEPPAATYPDALISNAKSYSDTAVIVISRLAGEGHNDIPQDMGGTDIYTNNSESYNDFEKGEHYLQLNKTERDLVDLVCSNFENVIFVYNGAYAFELGFVEERPQIKACVWAPGPGNAGFAALGEILRGTVNPSGKTNDTFVYDIDAAPYYNNAEKTVSVWPFQNYETEYRFDVSGKQLR